MAYDNLLRFADTFFLCFTLASMPVYVLLLMTLCRFRKHFSGAFFTFFISSGVADVWLTFHKYTAMHIPRWFFYKQVRSSVFLASWCKCGMWYIYFAQVLGVFLMTVNRLTAMCMPMQHRALWEIQSRIRIAIVLQWALPLVFAIPMLFPTFQSVYNDDLHPVFITEFAYNLYWVVDMILEPGLFATSFVVMYIVMTAAAVKQAKQKNLSAAQSKELTIEIRLAITGAIISGIYVVQCFTFILFAIRYYTWWLLPLFYYSSDLFTAANPWLLLALSKATRRAFLRNLGVGKLTRINSTVSTTQVAASLRHKASVKTITGTV